MNPLFELVTITPEIIQSLDDKKYYTYFRGNGYYSDRLGAEIKKHWEIERMIKIMLPHTEEKKVSEEEENLKQLNEVMDLSSVEVSKKPLYEMKEEDGFEEKHNEQVAMYMNETKETICNMLVSAMYIVNSVKSMPVPPLVIVSDEEIETKVNSRYSDEQQYSILGFIEGAKWMRDKLKGGNTK